MNQGSKNATERRSFLTRVSAAAAGAILMLFPFAAGWGVFVDPLRRRRGPSENVAAPGTEGFVRIAALDSLPADGLPHDFVVTADIADAWTRAVDQRIGEVFLIRTDVAGEPHMTAFTASCPHLGCAVEFDAAAGRFECPCHESGFGKDGQRLFGPSQRGLDPLAVKLVDNEGGKEIWVAFQRFRAGIAERVPVA